MAVVTLKQFGTDSGAFEMAKRASDKVRVLAAAIEELVKAVEMLDTRLQKLEGTSDSGSAGDQGSPN